MVSYEAAQEALTNIQALTKYLDKYLDKIREAWYYIYMKEMYSFIYTGPGPTRRKEPAMATTNNTSINNDVENFDIITELANLGALVDVDGILVSIETYIKYVGEIE